MTKPSEWDRETVWRESAKAHAETWDREGGMSALRVLPFPADPVERVSDETVKQYAACALDSTAKALAVEVLERRAGDKEQKG